VKDITEQALLVPHHYFRREGPVAVPDPHSRRGAIIRPAKLKRCTILNKGESEEPYEARNANAWAHKRANAPPGKFITITVHRLPTTCVHTPTRLPRLDLLVFLLTFSARATFTVRTCTLY